MHVGKKGGRIGGDMSETQIVKLPTTPDLFFKALTAAFAAADLSDLRDTSHLRFKGHVPSAADKALGTRPIGPASLTHLQ
jgi:hypothetical protein